jgi:CheY-like chemotaxis protein
VTTILVVEDEPAIALVLRLILEDEGYQVILAAASPQAWAQLTARRPDLVISDLMLPGLSGTALYQRMQADPGLAAVPVLLMSAAVEPELRPAGNYVGFLRKPFEVAALLLLVRQGLALP